MEQLQLITELTTILFATAALYVVRTTLRPARPRRLGRLVCCLLVFGTFGGLVWAENQLALLQDQPQSTNRVAGTAFTDRASPILLHTTALADEAVDLKAAEERLLDHRHLKNQVVRLSPGSFGTNCHGWVFTNGRFLLSGADVARILSENGYEEVNEPEPGDLAIYRQDGQIVHTSVVRTWSKGAPIVVEGKWDALSVFRHPVDQSVYGTDYRFYRTRRGTHLLHGI